MASVSHARQFILSNAAIEVFPDWLATDLACGWKLYYHANLEVSPRPGQGHVARYILGHAYNLNEITGTGAGRYALLDWPYVSTDAAALLGLHYGSREGRHVVSSSPGLAAYVLHGGFRPVDVDAPLEHRAAINYIPAPGTAFAGVRKLFHDQKIHLPSMIVEHRPSEIRPLASYGGAKTALAERLCGFAEELRRRVPGTVYLPLTAGLDSRLIAAAFSAAGLPFEAVTTEYVGKPDTDITVARAISRKLGIRHQVIGLKPFDHSRATALRQHTSGAYCDWENTHLFPGDAYRFLNPGDAMILGGCFEVGRQRSMIGCFAGADFGTITGEEVWLRRVGKPGPQVYYGFLDEWIAWRRRHPTRMHFASAFYLDQRLSGWRASIELGYDLLPGVALNPANDPQIYSALITPNGEDQRSGRLQRETVAMLAPGIAQFAYNPVSLRRRALRTARAAKALVVGAKLAPARQIAMTPAE